MKLNIPIIEIRIDQVYVKKKGVYKDYYDLGFKVSDNRGCSGIGETRQLAEYNYRRSVEQLAKLNAGYDIPFAGIDD